MELAELFGEIPNSETLVVLLDEILHSLDAEQSKYFLVLNGSLEGGATSIENEALQLSIRATIEREFSSTERLSRDLPYATKRATLLRHLKSLEEEMEVVKIREEFTYRPIMAWLLLIILFFFFFYEGTDRARMIFQFDKEVYLQAFDYLKKSKDPKTLDKINLHKFLISDYVQGKTSLKDGVLVSLYPELDAAYAASTLRLNGHYASLCKYGTLSYVLSTVSKYFVDQVIREEMMKIFSNFFQKTFGVLPWPAQLLFATFGVGVLGYVQLKELEGKKLLISVAKNSFQFVFFTPARLIDYSWPSCPKYNAAKAYRERLLLSLTPPATPRGRSVARIGLRTPPRAAERLRARPIQDRVRAPLLLENGIAGGGACFRMIDSRKYFLIILLVFLFIMYSGSVGGHRTFYAIHQFANSLSALSVEAIAEKYPQSAFQLVGAYSEIFKRFLQRYTPLKDFESNDFYYNTYVQPLEFEAIHYFDNAYVLDLSAIVAIKFAQMFLKDNWPLILSVVGLPSVASYVAYMQSNNAFDSLRPEAKLAQVLGNTPPWVREFDWEVTKRGEQYTLTKISRKTGQVQSLEGTATYLRSRIRVLTERQLTNGRNTVV